MPTYSPLLGIAPVVSALHGIPDFAAPAPGPRLVTSARPVAASIQAPVITHVVRFRFADKPGSWLDQHRVGEALQAVVDDCLGYGGRIVLEKIYALDLDGGCLADVTAAALHAVAAHCETEREEVPAGLKDAFATYHVPLPQHVDEDDAADPDAEHRLGPADCLTGARGW